MSIKIEPLSISDRAIKGIYEYIFDKEIFKVLNGFTASNWVVTCEFIHETVFPTIPYYLHLTNEYIIETNDKNIKAFIPKTQSYLL